VRGETPHFEYIAAAVSKGLMAASADTGVPMTFGVLTTNSVEEALSRAGNGSGNKGREAAIAAVEMASLAGQLGRARKRARAATTTRGRRSRAKR
jgi:6,7-dimethyl-8-ribityllumazine synthase